MWYDIVLRSSLQTKDHSRRIMTIKNSQLTLIDSKFSCLTVSSSLMWELDYGVCCHRQNIGKTSCGNLSFVLHKPYSNNLALNPLLHWFQTLPTVMNNPLHTLQQAVLHSLHLFRLILHFGSHHALGIIIALHQGPRETILKIPYFLLRDGCSSLIGCLALLWTLLDLFFATIFPGSG